jgi:hypothetical protein
MSNIAVIVTQIKILLSGVLALEMFIIILLLNCRIDIGGH